ncbi:hypothetical protein ACVW0Y_004750 [Pseudomonas sp. TE3786]
MITELRRRAYLNAMQVANWLPRVSLPFAAPSRPELLEPLEPEPQPLVTAATPVQQTAAAPQPVVEPIAPAVTERPKIEVPRPTARVEAKPVPVVADEEAPVAPTKVAAVPPPRFSLQLLRAGSCVILAELATGEPFASRDPAYLLLKDLLRAAGLPDSPQILGEPVRWPLLAKGNMDQGPQAALEYVQGVLMSKLEQEPDCKCIWLLGLPAIRFAGEADETAYNRELQVEGLGAAWAMPSLELLMDEPARKAPLWQAMQRVMRRWQTSGAESLHE